MVARRLLQGAVLALIALKPWAVGAQTGDGFQQIRPQLPASQGTLRRDTPRAIDRDRPSRSLGEGNSEGILVRRCEVSPFSGTLLPGGSHTSMIVSNNGTPCGVGTWRDITRSIPHGSYSIDQSPANGTITLVQPNVHPPGAALYTPTPGFRGRDRFRIRVEPGPGFVTVDVLVVEPQQMR
jgi:hypothetical protein